VSTTCLFRPFLYLYEAVPKNPGFFRFRQQGYKKPLIAVFMQSGAKFNQEKTERMVLTSHNNLIDRQMGKYSFRQHSRRGR
ncbi:MAG: hypothetical protein IKD44_04735, partial [Lentisphaeria bacterium]|nr:hypothetical protein [Lentisphaeria bacterium]